MHNDKDEIGDLFRNGFEHAEEPIPDLLVNNILQAVDDAKIFPKQEFNKPIIKPSKKPSALISIVAVVSLVANMILGFLLFNQDEYGSVKEVYIQNTIVDTVYVNKTVYKTVKTEVTEPKTSFKPLKNTPASTKTEQHNNKTVANNSVVTPEEQKEHKDSVLVVEDVEKVKGNKNPNSLKNLLKGKEEGAPLFQDH